MSTLKWVFLESTLALGMLLGLLLFALLVHWRRTLQPRPLLIGLVLAVVLLVVQAAVKTPRERFVELMGPVEWAVVEGDAARIGLSLSPDFTAGTMSKAEFLDFCRVQLARVDVNSLRRFSVTAELDAPETWRGTIAYSGLVSTGEHRGQLVTASWEIWFRRNGDGVDVITRIEPRKINGQSVGNWTTLEMMR